VPSRPTQPLREKHGLKGTGSSGRKVGDGSTYTCSQKLGSLDAKAETQERFFLLRSVILSGTKRSPKSPRSPETKGRSRGKSRNVPGVMQGRVTTETGGSSDMKSPSKMRSQITPPVGKRRGTTANEEVHLGAGMTRCQGENDVKKRRGRWGFQFRKRAVLDGLGSTGPKRVRFRIHSQGAR